MSKAAGRGGEDAGALPFLPPDELCASFMWGRVLGNF